MKASEEFMRRALELASRGDGRAWPNPMVGALIVSEGRVVGQGFHGRYGGPHAEAMALDRAGRRARGADLYVTLEPCTSFPGKKTPPCAGRIAVSGIRRVVVASEDPNPAVAGRGISLLRRSGIRVSTGLLGGENESLNRAYFKRRRTGLPYVVCKWAMTLDGKIATTSGSSRWITSPRARAIGRELRARLGAVLVGSNTAIADDPRLKGATRIILDSWARTPLTSRLVRTARKYPTIFAVSASCPEGALGALRRAGAQVHKFEVMDLRTILERVSSLGVPSILIEGGGEVHASAFEAGLADELVVFVAPVVFGGRDAKTPVEGRGIEKISRALRLASPRIEMLPGGEVMIRGLVR